MTDEWIMPPPMSPGDRVAIVAPAGGHAAAFPHVYELGIDRLRTIFDLEPVPFETASIDDETLRSRPELRADDLMRAFEDDSIDGVMATIGGDDQLRILPFLESAVFRENPKRFYGYSDNTAFASYLWNLGIASFQGPMVMTELAMQGEMFDYTIEYAKRAFFEETIGSIDPPTVTTDVDLDWADESNLDRRRPTEATEGRRWAGEATRVTGRTVGGNLETLVDLYLADRAVPAIGDLDGAILVLETSELLPPAWYVESAMQSFGERGVLEQINGLVVARAKAQSMMTERKQEARSAYRTDQRHAFEKMMARYNPDVPIVFDVAFGHTAPTVPMPIGEVVSLDPTNDDIRIGG